MSTLADPRTLTIGDLCTEALHQAGVIGVGQTPLAEDLNAAMMLLQFMLQQWERKRWLVYHLITLSVVSTGAVSYTVGPGGQLNTGTAPLPRPDRIESCFLRQINTTGLQPDYPMSQLQSMEDYNKIRLKGLSSFPGYYFYDAAWPTGLLYPWPLAQANIYQIFASVKAQLPTAFANQAALLTLPYEYYAAMLYNLTVRLWPRYRMDPDSVVVALAKDSLEVLRGANTGIAQLGMPQTLIRPGIYNIFSDTNY